MMVKAHVNDLQEFQPDAHLDTLPHTIALACHERHAKVNLHPDSIELVHEPNSRTHGRLADTLPHAINKALGCKGGERSA